MGWTGEALGDDDSSSPDVSDRVHSVAGDDLVQVRVFPIRVFVLLVRQVVHAYVTHAYVMRVRLDHCRADDIPAFLTSHMRA